jgi:hypothetical protein
MGLFGDGTGSQAVGVRGVPWPWVRRLCSRLGPALLLLGVLGWRTIEITATPTRVGAPERAGARVQRQAVTPSVLSARVVAVGIPGAGAVSPVGTFHPGGPIHDNPRFAAFTSPGEVLDPARVLVASSSNFGAPLARTDQPAGAILSLDPRGPDVLRVPATFAAGGDQATAIQGRAQLFTAQSPGFLNGIYNAAAVTADFPPVSDPRAISLNNAFGRLWFANAPDGAPGPGVETVVDPDGRPLADAPSPTAGGVFVGDRTNREPQLVPGKLGGGAVGTALLGTSPDGSGRAVFAVVNADGSVVQVHVEKGIDGLAPTGTISALPATGFQGANSTAPVATHAGTVFNWVPDPILYVADPVGNTVVELTLTDDGQVFSVAKTSRMTAPELNVPIDLAPAVPEVANPGFSSNTTLAGGSDLYVANRGDGTIARLRQDGTAVAVRQIEVPSLGVLGPGRLNGIAVAPDATRVWVTLSGALPDFPGLEGTLVELPAFSAAAEPQPEGPSDLAALRQRGEELFHAELTPEQGLGPLYNARGCLDCHNAPRAGGMGTEGLGIVLRVGQLAADEFDPLLGRGGPIARAHSVAELGFPCRLQPGIPAAANVTSVRNAPALFGLGLVDAIPDEMILAQAVPRGDGIAGRPHLVRDAEGRERVGRFGWKADVATLEQFVAEAFRNEHGITSPLAPTDLVPPPPEGAAQCAGESATVKNDGSMAHAVGAYVAALPAPPARQDDATMPGRAVFRATGCADCHVPSLRAADQAIPLYSDLLLHDVGRDLDDGVVQGQARGRDWRTTPLWGLGARERLLHDGRARSISTAITSHAGEAEPAVQRFRALTPDDRAALLAFLASR